MVLQTTQLQSSQSYRQAEKFSVPKKSLDLWLQELQLIAPILHQCVAVAQLEEEDWQQIVQSLYLTETNESKEANGSIYSELNRQLGALGNNIAQCSTILSASKADWRSLASFLSSRH